MSDDMVLFKTYLEKLEPKMREIASNAVTPERIIKMMIGEGMRNPTLLEAAKTPKGKASILDFFMTATNLGLEPGSKLGLFYPMPKRAGGDWCIIGVVGYKGYCELARRSGDIKRINAACFYEEEVSKGLIDICFEPPEVRHKYDVTITRSDDKLVGAYAVVELKDGGQSILVMNREDIIKRAKRGSSYGSDKGPWKSDFAAMCRKTVLRSLLSGGTVPLSADLAVAITEDADSTVDEPQIIDVKTVQEVATKPTGNNLLREKLGVAGSEKPVVDVGPDGVGYTDDSNPFPG